MKLSSLNVVKDEEAHLEEKATVIDNDNTFQKAIENAKKTSKLTELSFQEMLSSCSEKCLRKLRDYLKSNKATMTSKLDGVADFSPDVACMVSVRDYLDDNINKARSLLSESIIEQCSEDNCFKNIM